MYFDVYGVTWLDCVVHQPQHVDNLRWAHLKEQPYNCMQRCVVVPCLSLWQIVGRFVYMPHEDLEQRLHLDWHLQALPNTKFKPNCQVIQQRHVTRQLMDFLNNQVKAGARLQGWLW